MNLTRKILAAKYIILRFPGKLHWPTQNNKNISLLLFSSSRSVYPSGYDRILQITVIKMSEKQSHGTV